MAGSIIQVATNTVSSAVASVTLTGISTNDSYMVTYNNVTMNTSGSGMYVRTTTSGSADSDSEYDNAFKFFRSVNAFENTTGQGNDKWGVGPQRVASAVSANGVLNLFNFNDSSEYSSMLVDNCFFWSGSNEFAGYVGAATHSVAESNDGIHFVSDSGRTFTAGTFTLFKIQS